MHTLVINSGSSSIKFSIFAAGQGGGLPQALFTGEISGIGAAKLDFSAHAVPITYRGKDGKQYVAIVAAGFSALDDPGPPGADALVVFALP